MKFCDKCQIAFGGRNKCPLCALTAHNNKTHDFIEFKGPELTRQLVAYQLRNSQDNIESTETADNNERDAILQTIIEPLEAVDTIIGLTSVPSREELDCADEEYPKDYLGDGVYGLYDGHTIWLHATDPLNPTDRICLEPSTLAALHRFGERCTSWRNNELEKQNTPTQGVSFEQQNNSL